MISMTYNEAKTSEMKAIITIRDLISNKASLKMVKSNVLALIEDVTEEYNFSESAINSFKEILNQRTFKMAEFHLHNAFYAQLHAIDNAPTSETVESITTLRDIFANQRCQLRIARYGVTRLLESDHNLSEQVVTELKLAESCRRFDKGLEHMESAIALYNETQVQSLSDEPPATANTLEDTTMDMSQFEIDALMTRTTATERMLIALEVLKSKSSIKDALKESHFEDVEKMFGRFSAVFEELKQQRETELRLQREALQKKKLDTAFDALDVSTIGLTPEQILEQLAAKMGVSIKVPRNKSTSTGNAGTKKRKPQDKFVIKFINKSGDVDYIERITSGKPKGTGDLAEYLRDTGKKLKDLAIGRITQDGEYMNQNSDHQTTDKDELMQYLDKINSTNLFKEVE